MNVNIVEKVLFFYLTPANVLAILTITSTTIYYKLKLKLKTFFAYLIVMGFSFEVTSIRV